jgi:prevent-host-death family protein
MQISISEAKGHLTELVRRAEAGDEVVLTRHGKAAVRLVPVIPPVMRDRRRAVMEAAQRSAMEKIASGASAARSQDFLYDDDGLPK